MTLEKAKAKAERASGVEITSIYECDEAWLFPISDDDADDFITISKRTGLFLNYDFDDFLEKDFKLVWKK